MVTIRHEIRGENLEVTDSIRDYLETKLEKIQRYFKDEAVVNAHTNLKINRDEQRVEVTIIMPKLTLRAEDSGIDLYAATDLVVDKLERQIRKHKTKLNRKSRAVEDRYSFIDAMVQEDELTDMEENSFEITRVKQFNLKPMDAQEAILQMNMLGHGFFLYKDIETLELKVVYVRKDETYGLIEEVE